ncbi:hypothetical protein I2I05_20905 [Hymenobacter sp. BT683]|uniref:Uncharacterized protein n=1 Tax=Hymenobacter jeongseonensis TaxID=2791027 RepID=A0ABS0INA6_9BACT|nr:hypothetical protein [Hymenobacter jeongseonensis]MBF9239865.1 hypothetical protein [Hymenobacter jeongseonensis]
MPTVLQPLYKFPLWLLRTLNGWAGNSLLEGYCTRASLAHPLPARFFSNSVLLGRLAAAETVTAP